MNFVVKHSLVSVYHLDFERNSDTFMSKYNIFIKIYIRTYIYTYILQ